MPALVSHAFFLIRDKALRKAAAALSTLSSFYEERRRHIEFSAAAAAYTPPGSIREAFSLASPSSSSGVVV